MKIAITGAGSEVGRALADAYQSCGHTVIDISRSSGYDFSDLKTIVSSIEECDVFVNCLSINFLQTQLLYLVHEKWLGKTKHIINISTAGLIGFFGLKPEMPLEQNIYRSQKKSLEEAHWILISRDNFFPKMTLVRLSLLDNTESWDELAKFVVNTVHQDTYVFELGVMK